MPSVFFGHGNPMNAVQQNAFTDGWRRMAASIGETKGDTCYIGTLVLACHRRHDRARSQDDP